VPEMTAVSNPKRSPPRAAMTVVPISLGFIPSFMVGPVVKLRKHTMQWPKRQSHSGGGRRIRAMTPEPGEVANAGSVSLGSCADVLSMLWIRLVAVLYANCVDFCAGYEVVYAKCCVFC
jgi:hypothetical protein